MLATDLPCSVAQLRLAVALHMDEENIPADLCSIVWTAFCEPGKLDAAQISLWLSYLRTARLLAPVA